MKWYCNFIVKLHIFWVGNLVNINFWPLTLTVFIDFDGCWIMVFKNTPFFRSFSFLKFPENLKNWRISVFFFLAVLKSSGKTGGTGPQLSGATHLCIFFSFHVSNMVVLVSLACMCAHYVYASCASHRTAPLSTLLASLSSVSLTV